MLKFLAIGLDCADAASYYRIAPFFHLAEKVPMDIKIQTGASFVDLMNADLIYILRGWSADHVRIAKMAKSFGKKVWADFDDNCFAIEIDHPHWNLYSDPLVHAQIREIAKEADLVTVSNRPLLEIFPGSHLVENALDERYLSWRTPSLKPIKKLISWRGSNSHHKTIYEFAKQEPFKRLAKLYPEWKWQFSGFNPWQWVQQLSGVEAHILKEWLDASTWIRYLHDLKPTVNVVLLHDTPFNRGRSHTSYLENTLAGAITLAPDWEHWRLPNVIHYKNPRDFEKKLKTLLHSIENGYEPFEQVEESWEFILQNFTLKQINEKRLAHLKELQCISL